MALLSSVKSQGGSYATPLRASFSVLLTQITKTKVPKTCQLREFIGFPLRHVFKKKFNIPLYQEIKHPLPASLVEMILE